VGSQPCDRSKWSEKSKRSYSAFTRYEDSEFECRRCRARAVYTGEDKKRDYESLKRHISSHRILCQSCFKEKLKLDRKLADKASAWKARKKELGSIAGFAREWMQLLEDAPKFGDRRNAAIIAMLRRISQLAS
jgi:hypothetical protein